MSARDKRETLLPLTDAGDVISNRGGGLCSCFSDMSICCLGYWCPCYLFGRTAQRTGVVSSTLCGCLQYMMVFVVMWVLTAIVLVHFLGEISDYSDCEQATPSPPPAAGSGDGSNDGVRALEVGAPQHDHCNDLFWAAYRTYMAHMLLVDLLGFALFGALLGYYRQKIAERLGNTGSALKSFWLHCLPCTSVCALCQEARAVEASLGTTYGGLDDPKSNNARVSF